LEEEYFRSESCFGKVKTIGNLERNLTKRIAGLNKRIAREENKHGK
jgi:hypothetical protein